MSSSSVRSSRHRRSSSRVMSCLGAASMIVGCYSGDDIVGQPCISDADCVTIAGVDVPERACDQQLFVCVLGFVCGDGVLELGEECDDGNSLDGDGCSAFCTYEVGENGSASAGATRRSR